jgi:glycosyltransferase involved in cell wall biosynthesis
MNTGILPLLTFIIPVYNAEPYLRVCIDSILRANRNDIEIILVNDGSTDGSGLICNAYAERYPQLRTIHQHNQGVAAARNAGLQQATGDYVFFVDNDDWIQTDAVPHLIRLITEQQPDLIIHRYAIAGKEGTAIGNSFIDSAPKDQWGIEDFLNYVVKHRINILAPWEYVVKREILVRNKLSFRTDQSGVDDSVLTPLVLCACTSVVLNHDMLYSWRYRSDSQGKTHRTTVYISKMLSTIETLHAYRATLADSSRINYILYSIYKNLFSLFGKYTAAHSEEKKLLREFLSRHTETVKESVRQSGCGHRIVNTLFGNLYGLIMSHRIATLKGALMLHVRRIQ